MHLLIPSSSLARLTILGLCVWAGLPALDLSHGQELIAANTGRAGAAVARAANYSPTLTTLTGNRVYSTTQTLRNIRFTGKVDVTGGTVTFEFCSFESAPAQASAQLRQYNNGAGAGRVVCNWCDFDTGLRGSQGTFESTNVQFGERGANNPKTVGSSFALYRCRITGCGNLVGLHKYEASASSVVECLLTDPTSGGGSHPDGIEIYSANNVTVLRSRVTLGSYGQSCINICPAFGDVPTASPIILQDSYFNGGGTPILTNLAGGTVQRSVRFIGNRYGDTSGWDRECNFNDMDVTFDAAYALAHPAVIYWARTNVWAPNGEGVARHSPSAFIDESNFFGGEVWIWNGHVVGGSGANAAPVAMAQSVSASAGTTKAIILAANDADGDSLTFAIVGGPAHGTLTGSGSARSYLPATGYTGADSFTFKANDGSADSNVATVSITVTAQVNGSPVVSAASASPATVGGRTTALSATASDDGGAAALIYTWSASGPSAVVFSPNGTNAARASTATFAKAGGYTLTVTVRDAGGKTGTRTVAVTVAATPSAISLSPTSASVQPGRSVDFNATVEDQFGAALATQPTVTWEVSNGGTINAAGFFTAGSAQPSPSGGTSATAYTVSASVGWLTGTAPVIVSTASTSGGIGGCGGGGVAVAGLLIGFGYLLSLRRR